MCYACYVGVVETVSHRELRNRSGEVLRAVEAGESFTITNGGRVVARLVPADESVADLRLSRPAREAGGFGELTRHSIKGSVQEALEDLRGDR